jgi:hypothetical protein
VPLVVGDFAIFDEILKNDQKSYSILLTNVGA